MRKFDFTIRGNVYEVSIVSFDDGVAQVEVNGSAYEVELRQQMPLAKTPKLVRSLPVNTPPKAIVPAAGLKKVNAPLPGTIHKCLVKEGDSVRPGDNLLILEAMKMENNILAETAGTVKNLKVKDGDAVMQGDLLMELE